MVIFAPLRDVLPGLSFGIETFLLFSREGPPQGIDGRIWSSDGGSRPTDGGWS